GGVDGALLEVDDERLHARLEELRDGLLAHLLAALDETSRHEHVALAVAERVHLVTIAERHGRDGDEGRAHDTDRGHEADGEARAKGHGARASAGRAPSPRSDR